MSLPTPTEEQQAAIKHLGSPLIVLAGPGTGKTTVLALRVLFLLNQGLAVSEQILAVTFTTKAAAEMRDRLIRYGLPEKQHPGIATLHAVAARILHQQADIVGLPSDFLVTDGGECKLVLDDASTFAAKEMRLDIEIVRKAITDLRQAWYKGLTPSEVTGGPLRSLYSNYNDLMQFYRATDFDGLLTSALIILRTNSDALEKYRSMAKFLLIDEYQDINGAQHELLKLLTGKLSGVFAVGDDDQSIYSWRGGSPRLILDFSKSFPGASQITLALCQRCPGYILHGALGVISKNKNRIEKGLKPVGTEGEKIRFLVSKSENAEAKWIAEWIKAQVEAKTYLPSDVTVLSTDPTISELAFREVLKCGVKAVRKAGNPINSWPVRIIMSLIRTAADTSDNLAVRRSLQDGPVKGIGPKAFETILFTAKTKNSSIWEVLLTPKESGLSKWEKPLKEFVRWVQELSQMNQTTDLSEIVRTLGDALGVAEDENVKWLLKKAASLPAGARFDDFIDYIRSQVALDVTEESPADQASDAVCFLTTYLVKGLESKVVFVIGLEKDLFPDRQKDLEEQRRLFYVAMTRAKSELFLCTARMRKVRGLQFYEPSPFLADIPKQYTVMIDNS